MAGIAGWAGPLGASGEPLNTGGGGMTQGSGERVHSGQGWMVGPLEELNGWQHTEQHTKQYTNLFFVSSIEILAQEPCIYLSTLLVLHFTWPQLYLYLYLYLDPSQVKYNQSLVYGLWTYGSWGWDDFGMMSL